MTLKQRAASEAVHINDVALYYSVDFFVLLAWIILRICNGHFEDISVPLKRELVHGVDLVQVKQDEEKTGSHAATRPELISCFIYFFHCA